MVGCIYLIVLVAAVLWIVFADRKPRPTRHLERLGGDGPIAVPVPLVTAGPTVASESAESTPMAA